MWLISISLHSCPSVTRSESSNVLIFSMGQLQNLMPEKKHLRSRWALGIFLFVTMTLLYLVTMTKINYRSLLPSPNNLVHDTINSPKVITPLPMPPRSWSSFLVDSVGCRIPALAPLDAAVRQYVFKVEPIVCANNGRPLVASNLTALRIENAVLSDYNASDADQLDCCYQSFTRVEGDIHHYYYGVDDKIRFGKRCIPFKREVTIKEEFVKVLCKLDNISIYEDYHAFTPIKKMEVDGVVKSKKEHSVSVLLLGIDSVSRLNFHRQMPHTVKYLQNLAAIEMLGYNKVADNTFPNMVPVLSGLSEEELQAACWPTDETVFDACPWLWKNFSNAGYVTGFGEDAPWMGIFNYIKVGFLKQPTNYYMRPFSKVIEDEIGYKNEGNAKLCVGPRMTIEVLLKYMSKFVETMLNIPSFALFWTASLTHDFLNYPSLGDDLVIRQLQNLNTSGVLNRTVLVFMSDHGMRWDGIRETYQGRMEERLPLLFFVFPDWFRDRYTAAVANVAHNIHHLTSPYDLHKTLVDLLHPDQRLTQSLLRQRADALHSRSSQPRGISLFLPIPENRTCQMAGISPHWCTCQQSRPVPTNSSIVQRTALFLVEHINSLLKGYRQCATLKLLSVQNAQLDQPQEQLNNGTRDLGLHDYVIVVHTTPGDGAFEATVRHRPHVNNSLSMAGDVSRINAYGTQSICIDQFHLKLYCYCVL